jgi:pimeloyl-ACP methyl ester carboxylesterase
MTTATLLLVHGSWHGAWCWEKLLPELAARGVPAATFDLPGHGGSTEPLSGVAADAEATRKAAAAIDGPVVLVGHSSGGVIISEAAASLTNVVHLVYLSAFMLDVGESMATVSAPEERSPDIAAAFRAAGDGTSTIDPELAAAVFYNGCAPEDAARAASRLGRQLMATRSTPVSAAPWRSSPSTYVVTAQDKAILPRLQRRLAQRATHTAELDTGHSPFLAMPGALADILARAARLSV